MRKLNVLEIANAVNGKIIGNNNCIVTGITSDTRNIKNNDMFIAIKGEKFDGHNFADKAFESGAVCILSEKEIAVPDGKTVIVVKDTRKAYGDIAKYYLEKYRVPVVAITGSVGKTTTKDMISSVLSQKYNILKTQGNFNNDIGLPITVLSLEDDHELAVLEMGMNSFGEIERLSEIAQPDIAVITNVGVSHIENLGSREGILKAKCEIFSHMNKNGLAILNGDDDMLITTDGKLEVETIWFGIENKNGVYAQRIKSMGLDGVSCDIVTPVGSFYVEIPVPGNHMVLNAMAATAAGLKMGLNLTEIVCGIENFVPTGMRMAVSTTNCGIKLINDVYNANPVSMKAAIDVLSETSGRKVCILGDMFELGEFGETMHGDVGAYAAEKNIDVLIAIGELSESMYKFAVEKGIKKAYYFESMEKCFNDLNSILEKNDTILVKASRGMHFEKIVEKIQEVE